MNGCNLLFWLPTKFEPFYFLEQSFSPEQSFVVAPRKCTDASSTRSPVAVVEAIGDKVGQGMLPSNGLLRQKGNNFFITSSAAFCFLTVKSSPTEGVETMSDLRKEHFDITFHVSYPPCPKRL